MVCFCPPRVTRKARGGEVVDAIVPALWTRLDREKMPDVAQSVQFDHQFLGERYCSEGFYGIMKLQNYRARLPAGGAPARRTDHRDWRRERCLRRRGRGPRMERQRTLSRFRAPSARPARGVRRRPAPDRGAGPRHLDAALWAGQRIITEPRRTPGARTGRTIRSQSPTTPRNWPRNAWTASPSGPFEDDIAKWASNGRPVPPSLCLVDPWVSCRPSTRSSSGGLTRSRSPGSACSSPGTARTRGLTRPETISTQTWSSIWGASWPVFRGAARWQPRESPPSRTLARSCPR